MTRDPTPRRLADRDPADGFHVRRFGPPDWVWLLLGLVMAAVAAEWAVVFVALLHR